MKQKCKNCDNYKIFNSGDKRRAYCQRKWQECTSKNKPFKEAIIRIDEDACEKFTNYEN